MLRARASPRRRSTTAAGQGGRQNKANAAYVATTYFNGASVKKLDPSLESVVPPSATIAVVVGDDFAQTLVQ